MKHSILIIALALILSEGQKGFAQCQPYIKIDGNITYANQTVAAGLGTQADAQRLPELSLTGLPKTITRK